MHDAAAIEAINVEQLATATDRMLLRGQVARQWPNIPSLVPSAAAEEDPPLARGSRPQIQRDLDQTVTALARPALVRPQPAQLQLDERTSVDRAPPRVEPPRATPSLERTELVRKPRAMGPKRPDRAEQRARASRASRSQLLAVTLVIPALVGVAVGLASLLVL